MPKDIVDGRIDPSAIAWVTEDTARRLERHRLRTGTILLPRRGDITKHAIVSEATAGWLCGTGCLQVFIGDGDVVPEFLGYYLDLQEVGGWLEQHAVGTTMLNLSAKIVSKLPVRYPRQEVQQQIVRVLRSYDDLIANNQRRITLLEEAARQLYREWFVRLRFPGAEHTAIVDGVPEGWLRMPVSEAVHVNPRTKLSDDEEHCSVEMADLSVDGMSIESWSTSSGRSGSKFQNGDTLFARITPCLENGKTGFVNFLSPGQTARGSTEFIVLRARELTQEAVYCLARTPELREHARVSMVGASGRQRVQEECFDRYLVLVPSKRIAGYFTDVVRPMFEQIRVLIRQNAKLRTARDLLLPRLMSGELAP